MTTAQDDIDWLTRSENRVQALELLVERSYDRSELLEAVDVSRVTFNRMFEALDERGWIAQDDERKLYATPLGRIVIRDVSKAFDSAATAQKLHDIIEYLPTEQFDFDLDRLQNAQITRPTETDTLAPLNRFAELLSEATQRFTPLVANIDRLHTGGVNEAAPEHAEAIFTAEVMETILADSVMREDTIASIETGFDLYLYDGSASITLSLFDNTVGFELNDGSGFVPAFIETDDEAVLAWAEETYEQYKREAKPLDAEDFRA
jgi:predicted transcriptional regulator